MVKARKRGRARATPQARRRIAGGRAPHGTRETSPKTRRREHHRSRDAPKKPRPRRGPRSNARKNRETATAPGHAEGVEKNSRWSSASRDFAINSAARTPPDPIPKETARPG